MQIVYELKKNVLIDQDFDLQHKPDELTDLSYQPLRNLNRTTWYEG